MIDQVSAFVLALLEGSFVMVSLLILHGARKYIGNTPFHIVIGLLLLFSQIMAGAGLTINFGFTGTDFLISNTALFLPYLAALMIVYISQGTLAAQRLILGAMATLGIYVYLAQITKLQCDWPGYAISQGPTADALSFILDQSQRRLFGTILSVSVALFLGPIFYQRLRNLNCRIAICFAGAMLLTQVVSNLVFVTACYFESPADWLSTLSASYISDIGATLWFSALCSVYLLRIEKEIPGDGRGTLDIIFAFFGSYGRAKDLQRDLEQSRNRYQMVVENASDIIFVLDETGKIIDANRAACRIFKFEGKRSYLDHFVQNFICERSGSQLKWNDYCNACNNYDVTGTSSFSFDAMSIDGTYEFDFTMSRVLFNDHSIFVCVIHDITERNRFIREREELHEQLVHSQRLESIGKLAGGVAHDFNNYLQAIQGHVDLLTYMCKIDDPDVVRHIERISHISDQAAQLTQQLLGFARKGKYLEKVLDFSQLTRKVCGLFLPNPMEDLLFEHHIERHLFVSGDEIQLQQMILNILINARDAVTVSTNEEKEVRPMIRMDLMNASNESLQGHIPNSFDSPLQNYLCLQISDNGEGIEPDILVHIFEPFFTTKPVGKGTGMGLAMVYGTISNHKGTIHVESEKGKGTTFYIFLPLVDHKEENK